MKKITMCTLLLGSFIYAQQAPTGGAGGGAFWRKGGNTIGGGNPNIFGTFWNSPIYTYSNGVNRMIVNGDRTATIGAVLGGFNVPTNGYVGIGPNTLNLWSTKGPFSLLHLNGGSVPGPVQDLGYRPWMQTGVSFTDFNVLKI
ncbi:MAG: hypothetical protein IT232_10145 [Flavobacteriales bacterium]|nr:hypothetical protein [Flavobacteriales bacterium]